MQWTIPKEGTIRVRKGFLFFPHCMQGVIRWLTYAEWEEIYVSGFKSGWQDRKWLDIKVDAPPDVLTREEVRARLPRGVRPA